MTTGEKIRSGLFDRNIFDKNIKKFILDENMQNYTSEMIYRK